MLAKVVVLALAIVLAGFIIYRGISGWFSGWSTVPTLAHLLAGPTLLVIAVWYAFFRRDAA